MGCMGQAASSLCDLRTLLLPSLGSVSSASLRTMPSAALPTPGLVFQEPSAFPALGA